MVSSPSGDLLSVVQSVQLSTWRFLGLADDLAQMYRETRGYIDPLDSNPKKVSIGKTIDNSGAASGLASGPPKDWRAKLEKETK